MAERFVYLNGDYVPERDAKVSVLDRGFRWGDAVHEATRTFDGRLFKLPEHVDAKCPVHQGRPAPGARTALHACAVRPAPSGTVEAVGSGTTRP